MFNFLNRFGLPVKYAIVGSVSVLAGIILAKIVGMKIMMGYGTGIIVGAIGGAVGGFIRQKQGKNN